MDLLGRIVLCAAFAVIKIDGVLPLEINKGIHCAFFLTLNDGASKGLCNNPKSKNVTQANCSYHEEDDEFRMSCSVSCLDVSCHVDRHKDPTGILKDCSHRDPDSQFCQSNVFKYFRVCICDPTKNTSWPFPIGNTSGICNITKFRRHLKGVEPSKSKLASCVIIDQPDQHPPQVDLIPLIVPTTCVSALLIFFAVVILAAIVVYCARLSYKKKAKEFLHDREIRLTCVGDFRQNSKSFSRYHCVVPTWEDRQADYREIQQSDRIDNLIKSNLHKHEGGSPETFWEPSDEMEVLVNQMNEANIVEVPSSLLEMSELLGEGQFGEVWKGVWNAPPGSIDVAVKVLKLSAEVSEYEDIKLLTEAAVMGQFKHQNVVRLYGVVTTTEPNMFVMEYLCKGDLRSHLEQLHLRSEQVGLRNYLVSFCQQVANGMCYLSKKGYIHRDLAARNIMLDFSFTCKITDFGLARKASVVDDGDHSGYYFTAGGNIPLKWTAPEAVLERKYSSSSDVWSYGMVLYEIWSLGEKPFSNKDAIDIITCFHQCKDYIQSPPPGCPRKIYKLMILCWNLDHHQRPHFEDILQSLMHPDNEWLEVSSEDANCTASPESAKRLGEHLKNGLDLYKDLQQYYISDSKAERENKI